MTVMGNVQVKLFRFESGNAGGLGCVVVWSRVGRIGKMA